MAKISRRMLVGGSAVAAGALAAKSSLASAAPVFLRGNVNRANQADGRNEIVFYHIWGTPPGGTPAETPSPMSQLIAAFKGWRDTRNDPSKAICHGDGTPLERVAVEQACDLADELSFDVPWQRGDVALLDNFIAMHGRRTFSGTRKVLASLADAHRVG